MRYLSLFLLLSSMYACAQSSTITSVINFSTTCTGNGALTRTEPSGLPALPFTPNCVDSYGNVSVTGDAISAFLASNTSVATGECINVSAAWGADTCTATTSCTVPTVINGNTIMGAPQTLANTCATMHAALSASGAQKIAILDATLMQSTSNGRVFPFDFRQTNTDGTLPKLVYSAAPGGQTTIEYYGDTISNDSWTVYSGNIYEATCATCVAGTSGDIGNVLFQDGTVDAYGFPQRLIHAQPNWYTANDPIISGQYVTYTPGSAPAYTCYQATTNNPAAAPPSTGWSSISCDTAGLANLALLAAAGKPGYYHSFSSHIIYVYMGATFTASRIRALYYQPGNNNARAYLAGVTIGIANVYFDGGQIECLETGTGPYYPSSCYLENVTTFGVPLTYGTEVRGSSLVGYRVRAHANGQDGMNADVGPDAGATVPCMITYAFHSTWAGDPSSYFSGGTLPGIFPNNNGVSSHNGCNIMFAPDLENNVGPELADLSSISSSPVIPSNTWVVGGYVGNVNSNNTGNVSGYQFGGVVGSSQGDARNRNFWCDTCSGFNEGIYPMYVESYATGKIFNSSFLPSIQYNVANPVVSYTPGTP